MKHYCYFKAPYNYDLGLALSIVAVIASLAKSNEASRTFTGLGTLQQQAGVTGRLAHRLLLYCVTQSPERNPQSQLQSLIIDKLRC